MAQSDCSHEVSAYVLLLSSLSLSLSRLLLLLLLLVISGSDGDIAHRPIAKFTVFEQLVREFIQIVKVKMGILHRKLFEDHVVLGQRSRLVSQKVLNSAEFFRDRTVPRYCTRHVSVSLDPEAVKNLGQVQIHPQRDRNNR